MTFKIRVMIRDQSGCSRFSAPSASPRCAFVAPSPCVVIPTVVAFRPTRDLLPSYWPLPVAFRLAAPAPSRRRGICCSLFFAPSASPRCAFHNASACPTQAGLCSSLLSVRFALVLCSAGVPPALFACLCALSLSAGRGTARRALMSNQPIACTALVTARDLRSCRDTP